MINVLLVGNPNVGKTTLFNNLTNSNQKASNWNGVTVDIKKKTIQCKNKKLTFFDLPGINSLSPKTEEEVVAVKEIEKRCKDGAQICVVCDAVNLKKSLSIALELFQKGIVFDIVVNMINEVTGNFEKLKSEIEETFKCNCFLVDGRKIGQTKLIKNFYASKENTAFFNNINQKNIYKNAEIINEKIENACKNINFACSKMEKLDLLLCKKWAVVPLFILLFLSIFYLAFGHVGSLISSTIERYLVGGVFGYFVSCATSLNPLFAKFLNQVLVSGVGSVMCFLPQILILFAGVAFLENSGFLARVALVLDPFFKRIGLSGKSVFSLLAGFGCTTSAVLVTRNLESRTIRRRAALALPFFGCSAKLPILLVVSGLFFEKCKFLCVFCVYFASILVFLLVFSVIGIFCKNEKKSFFVRLPRLRLPDFLNVLRGTFSNFFDFFKRTILTIFSLCCLLFFISNFKFDFSVVDETGGSVLEVVSSFFAPIFAPLGFGFWGVVAALIFGLVAKEMLLSAFALVNCVSLSGLSSSLVSVDSVVHFSLSSSLSFLLFIMLFTPCIPSLRMISREIGRTWSIFVALFQFAVAYVSALFLYQICVGNFVFVWILITVVVAFVCAFVLKCRAKGGCYGCCNKNCSLGRKGKIV